MSYLSKAALLVATASWVSVASAETLSLTHPSPPGSASGQVLQEWAQQLNEATDGGLNIEFYWQQALSRLGDNLDAVGSGLADIGLIVPAYHRQQLPLAYLSSTATGSGDPYVISRAWNETREAFPEIQEEEAARNLHFLAIESIGPVLLIGNRFYVTPDDFQNATMRLASHYAFAAQSAGWPVNPARIQAPETYTSLERGTISGAASYADQILPFRLNEVTDYLTLMGLGQHANMYYINRARWNSLSPEHQEAITQSLPDLNTAFARLQIQEAQGVFDAIESDPVYPVQIYALTAEERETWAEALAPSYENNVAQAAAVNEAATEIAEAFMGRVDSYAAQLEDEGYPW
ncbi:MAG: TRAP transporter substrate-binding protein DctP [Pararhodobacter sp.]|nr:TRAP transporter substrate-binding protein DctP [Pararhodobacter sp.]